MLWNTPLSVAHAADLLARLDVAAAGSLLDLGCGRGELLLRALAAAPAGPGGCAAVGVDTSSEALVAAREAAARRGLSERARFVVADASGWSAAEAVDRCLCIGAAHAWAGGAVEALRALHALTAPGGRALFGDGCWTSESPAPEAVAIFGDAVLSLPALVQAALDAGWRVLHLDTADEREWDAFESASRATRDDADERLLEYVTAYRGRLGFAYLVLG